MCLFSFSSYIAHILLTLCPWGHPNYTAGAHVEVTDPRGKERSVTTKLFGSVHSLSRVQLFAAPWIAARQASPSIKPVMPSNHLTLCHPLLLPRSIFPSIRVFSNEPVLHIRWLKDWSFSFSISPSNEHPGLISFRMDLLAVQRTLKSLLQPHSS